MADEMQVDQPPSGTAPGAADPPVSGGNPALLTDETDTHLARIAQIDAQLAAIKALAEEVKAAQAAGTNHAAASAHDTRAHGVNNDNTLADSRSGKGTSHVPRPSKFNDGYVRKSKEAIKAWYETVCAYIERMGEPFPAFLRHFMDDEPAAWLSAYLESAKADDRVISPLEFQEAFIMRFTGEVRSESIVALERLVNHEVVQGKDTVGVYAEKFQQVSRLLSCESQVSLCKHYVAGLSSDMKARCCLDRDGKEWTNLSALIQFSFAEDVRAQAIARMLGKAPHALRHAQDAAQEAAWKKQKNSRGSAVAAVGSSASRTPAAQQAPGPVRYNPPANLGPVENCPAFGVEGKLTPEARKQLRDHWVCTYCRKARHAVQLCPVKAEVESRRAAQR